MRTKGAALASASDWLFNYFIVQLTPLGIHHLRWKFYIIFFILNAVFVPLVYLFYPETAGKSLEEIDLMFAGNEKRYFVVNVDQIMPSRFKRTVDIEELSLIRQHNREVHRETGPGGYMPTNNDHDDEVDDLHSLGSDDESEEFKDDEASTIFKHKA